MKVFTSKEVNTVFFKTFPLFIVQVNIYFLGIFKSTQLGINPFYSFLMVGTLFGCSGLILIPL